MPRVKLIYLTGYLDSDTAAEAFRSGASGYLVKNSAASELVQAIHEVVRGGSYLTPLITAEMVGPFIQNFRQIKESPQLSLRRKEMLQLLVEGHSMKEVAFMPSISPRTVAYHK